MERPSLLAVFFFALYSHCIKKTLHSPGFVNHFAKVLMKVSDQLQKLGSA